jgi:hypothetical protein
MWRWRKSGVWRFGAFCRRTAKEGLIFLGDSSDWERIESEFSTLFEHLSGLGFALLYTPNVQWATGGYMHIVHSLSACRDFSGAAHACMVKSPLNSLTVALSLFNHPH